MLATEHAWRFSRLYNPEALEAVSATDLKLIICEDAHESNAWKEFAGIARCKNPDVFFILLSSNLTTNQAYCNGADIVIAPGNRQELLDCLRERMQRTYQSIQLTSRTQAGTNHIVEELQEKNKTLEKVSYELDRFVYSASHDLRAPLTSILGLLYLLRSEVSEDGPSHYIKLMEESVLKLDNTIKDIVAYSRNNRQEISSEPVVLNELVADILSGLRYLETADLNLPDIVEVQPVELFFTDRNRLQVILNNLLANAIRFRHPARKPEIKIRCMISGNDVQIDVSDNGIGISDRHIDRIFDMFYRSNEGSTGSGLGLYIVRETVRKMGGDIHVTSEIDKGACFTISIPQIVETTYKEKA